MSKKPPVPAIKLSPTKEQRERWERAAKGKLLAHWIKELVDAHLDAVDGK